MKIKLIEDLLVCPACSERLSGPGLQRCNFCGMECYLETDEANHNEEQIRLLLSRDAVLREAGFRDAGGSRW